MSQADFFNLQPQPGGSIREDFLLALLAREDTNCNERVTELKATHAENVKLHHESANRLKSELQDIKNEEKRVKETSERKAKTTARWRKGIAATLLIILALELFGFAKNILHFNPFTLLLFAMPMVLCTVVAFWGKVRDYSPATFIFTLLIFLGIAAKLIGLDQLSTFLKMSGKAAGVELSDSATILRKAIDTTKPQLTPQVKKEISKK